MRRLPFAVASRGTPLKHGRGVSMVARHWAKRKVIYPWMSKPASVFDFGLSPEQERHAAELHKTVRVYDGLMECTWYPGMIENILAGGPKVGGSLSIGNSGLERMTGDREHLAPSPDRWWTYETLVRDLAYVRAACAESGGKIRLCTSAAELDSAYEAGAVAATLDIQDVDGGLTKWGRRLVGAMNDLGMVVDTGFESRVPGGKPGKWQSSFIGSGIGGLRSGDSLTLHICKVRVCGSGQALAAILGDGSVVAWGSDNLGGISPVQDMMKNVQHLQSSENAFAAILGDGSVVTWGDAGFGGDSGAVQGRLKNVQQIQASRNAFAAILADGSVVTWGDAGHGGDSNAVQGQLSHVQHIQATHSAFAAILDDGSVVTWGNENHGGDSSSVQKELQDVSQIQASAFAFAAVRGDGYVVTWGNAACGGDSSAVQDRLQDVKQIQASNFAFSAIRSDGCVVTWGSLVWSDNINPVQHQVKNVQQVQANPGAFAAILNDCTVVTWGAAASGGDSSAVQALLKNVRHVQANGHAFAAILHDGGVVTWGHAAFGGDSSAVQDQLKNVQHIQSCGRAFAALLADGSVVTWGHADYGGDSEEVQGQLKDVQEIEASFAAFAAILGDGSVVTWGEDFSGGDSRDSESAQALQTSDGHRSRQSLQAAHHVLPRRAHVHLPWQPAHSNRGSNRAVADAGGVFGVVCVPAAVNNSDFCTVGDLVDNIDAAVKLVGEDHVGFGSDFLMAASLEETLTAPEWDAQRQQEVCVSGAIWPFSDGHKGYENNAGYRNVTRGLVAKGYSDEAVRKVMGGNFLRVFRDVVG
ncbi:hypothetical protein AK812_SmicGene43513 [Symbiodinium microadriaticum]|uniref:Dipeptidase n=1 Tax=Symbiodinium microadriaticum TaxID=2951 RepID=A0A1Q9C0V4_SYMMI|nr:hypothetical protein AK812_SmicGene43513 [Symbiodinium microadriaticum]